MSVRAARLVGCRLPILAAGLDVMVDHGLAPDREKRLGESIHGKGPKSSALAGTTNQDYSLHGGMFHSRVQRGLARQSEKGFNLFLTTGACSADTEFSVIEQ